MSISKDDVMSLRDKTGAGLIDCKRALTESNGNMDEAVSILRKKGVATAAKKSGRSASEGIIAQSISSDRSRGILVEVNCETDFVAKNDDFVVFHRVAISENQLGKGYAKQMMLSIEDYALNKGIYSVKADTNHDNGPMKNIFEKLGYIYCGKVYFRGSPRMAYEKVLKK